MNKKTIETVYGNGKTVTHLTSLVVLVLTIMANENGMEAPSAESVAVFMAVCFSIYGITAKFFRSRFGL